MKLICLFFALVFLTTEITTAQIEVNDNSFPDYSPSIALENPVGGGQFGQVALGFSYQHSTRIAKNDDASAAVYIGLGDPIKYIGAGVNVNIYGLTNNFGEKDNVLEGGLDIHLNRYFLDKKLLVDVGLNNASVWGGNSYITYQRSLYFSANYLLYLKEDPGLGAFSYISLTAGAGNGYFRSDDNYADDNGGNLDPFLSIACPVFKNANVILEWNGYDFAGGLSILPMRKFPVVFTAEITDINYGKTRLITSASFPLQFFRQSRSKSGNSIRPLNVRSIRPVRTI